MHVVSLSFPLISKEGHCLNAALSPSGYPAGSTGTLYPKQIYTPRWFQSSIQQMRPSSMLCQSQPQRLHPSLIFPFHSPSEKTSFSPYVVFILIIWQFHIMHSNHIPPTSTLLPLCSPQRKRVHQVQFVLSIDSLAHGQAPSSQALKDNGVLPHYTPTRRHQLSVATLQHYQPTPYPPISMVT